MSLPPALLRFGLASPILPTSQLTLRFVAALILANAPYWWLGHTVFMSRALFNLDVTLALCVLPFSALAGLALLWLAWAADWILNQSLTFYFRSPHEFMDAFRYATELDYSRYLSVRAVLMTLPFIAASALLVHVTRARRRLWLPAVVLSSLLALVDAFNGSSILSDRGGWRYGLNIAGSPTATLTAQALQQPSATPLRPLPIEDTVLGMVDVAQWATSHDQQSVLFVIVESLGVPVSPAFYGWLRAQLIDPAIEQRFEARTASLPFRGSTTAGELRSLCGLAGSYRSLDEQAGAECLPARLSRQGWTTVGMHGFSKQMFNRTQWWPAIGLQSSVFIDAPEFEGKNHCGGAFRGGCDEDLIDSGVKALAPGKRFVYLLTLNTHLPIEPSSKVLPAPALCGEVPADTDICQHLARAGETLRHLRDAIKHVEPRPLVIVVGDHAPPFANMHSRQAYLQDKVPAAVLLPRE